MIPSSFEDVGCTCMCWCCWAPSRTWVQKFVSQSPQDLNRNFCLQLLPFREHSVQRTCQVGWVELCEMSGPLEGLMPGEWPIVGHHCLCYCYHVWNLPRKHSDMPPESVRGSCQHRKDLQCVWLLNPACWPPCLWRLSLCTSEASAALSNCETGDQLQILELSPAPLFGVADAPLGLDGKGGSGGTYGLIQSWGKQKVK